jgi:hypothetical protein
VATVAYGKTAQGTTRTSPAFVEGFTVADSAGIAPGFAGIHATLLFQGGLKTRQPLGRTIRGPRLGVQHRLNVAEDEALAFDDLARFACDRLGEDRSAIHEGVELAILAAGIDLRGQVFE